MLKGWYFDGEHWYPRDVEDGYECSMAVGWQDIGKYRWSLGCYGCRAFWVDGKMYLAEKWQSLRQGCTCAGRTHTPWLRMAQ